MSTFRIPNNNQIRQLARFDTAGELKESFSIDINNPYGKIKASKKLTKVLDESDFKSSNDRVQALAVYDPGDLTPVRYFAINDEAVLICSVTDDPTNSSNWTDIDDLPGLFDESNLGTETDAAVYNGLLLISLSQDILSWNGAVDDVDWWTTVAKGGETGTNLIAGYPHTMHVHQGGQETLFVTDKNLVHYANETAGHSTITLSQDQIAVCVDSGVNAIWVGTYSTSSNQAYVYEIYVGEQIDSVPVARNAYKVDGYAVLSLTVLNNVPYIITEKGNLQAFNGAGFTTVASLPFSGTSFVFDDMDIGNIDPDSEERPVHPKGMRAFNDSIFINVNTESSSRETLDQDPYAPNTPSGIYEYNTVTGQLHHRYAFSESISSNGAKRCNYSGPLLITDSSYTFLMAGTEINNSTAGLFMESADHYGYFTTTEIMSGSITDTHESGYLKAKTLADGESITLKYRTTKRDNIFADGSLAAANEFNTTETVTGATVGDELTVIDGPNAGKTAHITAINTGTTTNIVLDGNVGTTGDSVSVEITNFKKVSDTYTIADGEVKRWGDFGTNPWIQYKVILDGDIEVREFISKGNSKQEM